MPRANRYILPGYTYHVTHRCHDRSFLLKFALDRDAYRKMLRERLQLFPVSLFTYSVTSNHVHLVLRVKDGHEDALARFMQSLAGDFAQYYNIRKGRKGAFWSDRYHAVMIDEGPHLWNCLKYVDLNMVRAGVVEHPRDWDWCGYRELVGIKKRNRLIDRGELVRGLGDGIAFDDFSAAYEKVLEEELLTRAIVRERRWTESLAVGGREFAERVGGQIPNRMSVVVESQGEARGPWVVREERAAYGS
jgi:putative transposase